LERANSGEWRQDPDVFVNAFAIEEALQMHESNGYWTLSSKKA
jgi:GT2 family glycosyltransferase